MPSGPPARRCCAALARGPFSRRRGRPTQHARVGRIAASLSPDRPHPPPQNNLPAGPRCCVIRERLLASGSDLSGPRRLAGRAGFPSRDPGASRPGDGRAGVPRARVARRQRGGRWLRLRSCACLAIAPPTLGCAGRAYRVAAPARARGECGAAEPPRPAHCSRAGDASRCAPRIVTRPRGRPRSPAAAWLRAVKASPGSQTGLPRASRGLPRPARISCDDCSVDLLCSSRSRQSPRCVEQPLRSMLLAEDSWVSENHSEEEWHQYVWGLGTVAAFACCSSGGRPALLQTQGTPLQA